MGSRFTAIATVIGIGFSLFPAPGQEPNPSVANQLSALLKEYSKVSGSVRTAGTDGERKQIVEKLVQFPGRFFDLADRNPGHPLALKALRDGIQALNTADSAALNVSHINTADFPSGCEGHLAGRAIEILRRDHLENEALGNVCDRMRYGYRLEYEGFLRTVLETSV